MMIWGLATTRRTEEELNEQAESVESYEVISMLACGCVCLMSDNGLLRLATISEFGFG